MHIKKNILDLRYQRNLQVLNILAISILTYLISVGIYLLTSNFMIPRRALVTVVWSLSATLIVGGYGLIYCWKESVIILHCIQKLRS